MRFVRQHLKLGDVERPWRVLEPDRPNRLLINLDDRDSATSKFVLEEHESMRLLYVVSLLGHLSKTGTSAAARSGRASVSTMR